jgi:ketosteroid isomerase-like protein
MKTMIAVWLFLWTVALPAQQPTASPSDEVTHNQLRALLAGMKDAINKGDVERELTYLHPNVVVTWHNAEVSRGRDGVRAYLNRILNGPNKFIASYTAEVEADELTILYGGQTGISFGSATEHFKLTNGKSLDLPSRWSATLVKDGDKWLIASLHASDNLFDNPLLSLAKKMTWMAGIGCLVVGLLVGSLWGKRKRTA